MQNIFTKWYIQNTEKTETCSAKSLTFIPDTKIKIPISTKIGQRKISRFGLIKLFALITGLTFVSYFLDGNLAWDYTPWKPVGARTDKEYVIWHYGFTMAVLEFLGRKRTLVNCRLILVETR